jgi:CRISPR/Cas system CSM-associated protein Csm3 (group 7 of RAMP superfamily)
LWVLGVEVRAPDRGQAVAAFHRTAINSWSGAAAVGKLFDGEGLAAGSQIVVRIALEDPGTDDMSALCQALSTWTPRLGRGTSIGAGRVETEAIETARLDLSVMRDMLKYLNSGGSQLVDDVIADRGKSVAAVPTLPEFLIDEEMEVVDALHVGAVKPASGNTQELVRDTLGEPLIPGSTLKGVLRSRVEYILRSVGLDVCPDGTDASCPTCHLFGYALSSPDDQGRTGRRGRIAVRDAQVPNAREGVRSHVAIDRVTGGARDQALFATEVVTEGVFRIQVEALETVPEWTRGLLLAALADIDEGYVGLGGGTTRGQGTVKRVGGSVREEYGSDIRAALTELGAGRRES